MVIIMSVDDPHYWMFTVLRIQIQSRQWIRIRIQESQNDPQEIRNLDIFRMKSWLVFLKADGFSSSLEVLHRGTVPVSKEP